VRFELVVYVWFGTSTEGGRKMGYEQQPRRSAWTVLVIVVPVIFMVVGGLFILALAGWLYFRISQERQVATVDREQAVVAEQAVETARAQADQARQRTGEVRAELGEEPMPSPQVTVELDQDGELKINGAAIEFSKMLDKLKALAADEPASITMEVRADKQCPFQHVAELISACQEVGIARFRFSTLDAAIAGQLSEAQEPGTVID
jgi:biopolymer transport protein ExbD